MDQEQKPIPHGIEIPSKPSNIKLIKTTILAVVSALLFLFDWYLLNIALNGDKNLDFWIWPILLTALAIAALSFFALVNNNRYIYGLLNGLIFVGYLFFMPKDLYVVIGGILFLVLSLWFESRIRAEETSRADFSMRRVLAGSIAAIIYGLLLMLGFNIYSNTSQDFKANPDAFYGQLGKSTAAGVEKVDLNQTLSQFLTDQGVSGEENEELQKQILRQFGLSSSGDQQLSEIIAQAFTAKIKQAAQPYEKLFPLIFTLIILGFLRTFAFLFRWLTIFITWLLFRLLVKFKFFRIEKVPVEVRKLTI